MRSPEKQLASPAARSTDRHHDLRHALVQAGIALARQSGPAAVTLRGATRGLGVVPNAAYRHFGSVSELLDAVRSYASAAAEGFIQVQLRALAPPRPESSRAERVAHARARLRAVGCGYVRFAVCEPGWFQTAFATEEGAGGAGRDAAACGRSCVGPRRLLGAALDHLVALGVLPLGRRDEAQYVAWSAVHGLAMLVMTGRLRAGTPRQLERLTRRTLDMIERSI